MKVTEILAVIYIRIRIITFVIAEKIGIKLNVEEQGDGWRNHTL